MSSTGRLVMVFLVGSTDTSKKHAVTTASLNAFSNLAELRLIVEQSLSSLEGRSFVFLTASGWEVSELMEETVPLSEVTSEDGCVSIRMCYRDKRRIGVCVVGGEGGRDTPIGYVFCDLRSTARELSQQMKEQVLLQYQGMLEGGFFFLDHNGWPVSSSQELSISVLELVVSNVVRIRCVLEPSSASLSPRPTTPMCRYSTSGAGARGSLLAVSGSTRQELLISYVHSEASSQALSLKAALERLDCSVFLDVCCIGTGVDWQDALNEAISNCLVFVPLVTSHYGLTLWTNREVKLADVLGKVVLPVNFLGVWPPKCLAIQFATTQFIPWSMQEDSSAAMLEQARVVASKISDLRQQIASGPAITEDEEDTQPVDDGGASSPPSPCAKPSPIRKPSCRSYASCLPKTCHTTVQRSREGPPLVALVAHFVQKSFSEELCSLLEGRGYEVWNATELACLSCEEKAREVFLEKVCEAGVVVLVLCKRFVESCLCEQELFYCEQRKRIVTVACGPVELPEWAVVLLGRRCSLIDSRSPSYEDTLLRRVEQALSPSSAQEELNNTQLMEERLSKLCGELLLALPKGRQVYVSGQSSELPPHAEQVCVEFGRRLARERNVVLVVGGWRGAGGRVARAFRSEQQGSSVYRVVAKDTDLRDSEVVGETVLCGRSEEECGKAVSRALPLCVVMDGSLSRCLDFAWSGNQLLSVGSGPRTAAACEWPCNSRPPGVCEEDWRLVREGGAEPGEVAGALVRVVRAFWEQLSAVRCPALLRSQTAPAKCLQARKRPAPDPLD